LAELFETLARRVPVLSRSRRKKLALAYLLVAGHNDSDTELDAFVRRALPLGIAIHLYAYNPVPTSTHAPVERTRYEEVYERLSQAGLSVRMSSRARVEANGGCGTLVALRISKASATPMI
jgi:23S rRNA (adenine2503-C2)-methyltransferase